MFVRSRLNSQLEGRKLRLELGVKTMGTET